ncbi:uncharacterized protein LOC114363210 [Ostrinia furnacalis]|uniref:uncharacterized protein LOC114363210 n=1 Tax=Ostrinia furnacalis TaxID=93504 RepID=UPI001038BD51|nr:uncharacterized protein LOC114363210 [Ostrinia furnacalis]
MEAFLIIILISLIVNFFFVFGAILYTLLRNEKEPSVDPRVSTTHSTTASIHWQDASRRHSSHPQVMLYHTFVRLSIASDHHRPQKNSFWQKFKCGSSNKVAVAQ